VVADPTEPTFATGVPMEPKVIRPDDAQRISLNDVGFNCGIGAAQSDGTLSMLEVTIPPKTLIKPHLHTREDEFSLVLAGPIGARMGDDTTEELPTGTWIAKPRNVPHAMWNLGATPARILEVVVPGGLEAYFEEIAPVLREHGPEWTERYKALAIKYGLTILDDWSKELQERYGITL
jgi:quercetin dioxygenase-like cupin family protein